MGSMPRVFIPPAMRPLVDGQEIVEAVGGTVREVIDDLERRYPGIKERLCQNDALRPGLAVMVGGSTSALGLLQRVDEDAEIHFLPIVGGG
jgi:molybdopterin synthase sulfur carrier subunit